MTLVMATIHHISYVIIFLAILTVTFQWTIRICNYNTSLGCASLTILLSVGMYFDIKCYIQ